MLMLSLFLGIYRLYCSALQKKVFTLSVPNQLNLCKFSDPSDKEYILRANILDQQIMLNGNSVKPNGVADYQKFKT